MSKQTGETRVRRLCASAALLLLLATAGPVCAAPQNASDRAPATRTVYSLTEHRDLFRIQGRYSETPEGITLDNPGSGISFWADCRGEVKVKLKISFQANTTQAFFAAYVDGRRIGPDRGRSIRVPADGKEDHELTLAENLAPGEHRLELYRENESGLAYVTLESVSVNGKIVKSKFSNPRIEFIGDSITAGYGVYTQGPQRLTDPFYGDATSGYAFEAAHSLDLNFSILAVSGYGLVAGYGKDHQMRKVYPFTNWFRDNSEKGLYSFRPPCDIVCINLGTNDWNIIGSTHSDVQVNNAMFYQAVEEFTKQIRSYNPDAQVVWLYGMMIGESSFQDMIRNAVRDMGGEAEGIYSYALPPGTSGILGHPNLEEQQRAANELKRILRYVMQKADLPYHGVDRGPRAEREALEHTQQATHFEPSLDLVDNPIPMQGPSAAHLRIYLIIGTIVLILVLSGSLLLLWRKK